MKIDVFCHIQPKKYLEEIQKDQMPGVGGYSMPSMYDLDVRFKIMDKFEPLIQMLTISMPAVEGLKTNRTVELAKLANDEMAELVHKYPD
jgi:hypothetical protein